MPDTSAPKDFVISRVFDAPRDLVWQCFMQADRMKAWWGPAGVKIVKSKMDFRVDGTYLYGMQNANGDIMWGRQVFREISPPQRIVFVSSFSDEAGGLTRHPLAPQWPLQMLSTYTFEEMPGGKTKFTVRWQPYEAMPEEQAVFAAGQASMTGGWTGTLDKLETYLAGMQQQQQQ